MCRAHATTQGGFAGHADAAPPASRPTSQAPSPRRPPPSSRIRDIPRHREPGRRRRAGNVPTKQARSRRLTIWVFLRPPPILHPPAGAGPRPAWRNSLTSHRLAQHFVIDACEKRATHLQLPVDGPRRFAACGDLEQPSLAWSKGGTRGIAGAQHELRAREYAAMRVVEVAPV